VSKAFGYRGHQVGSSKFFRNVVNCLLIIAVSYTGTLNRHCQGSGKQLNYTSTIFTKPFNDFFIKNVLFITKNIKDIRY